MKSLPCVLAIAALAGTASADDRTKLLAEGAALSNAGDHAGAIARYEQAYRADRDPALLAILASEYRRAGLPADAMAHYCQYLAARPKGADAAFVALQILAIRAELGESGVRICEDEAPPIRIDFTTPRRMPAQPAVPAGMSKREVAGVATAAVGLASLGASLYYGARARDISSTIADHDPAQPWPDNIGALQARGQRYEDRQKLFAIAGGAALVTAGILYFTGRADRLAAERVIIAPSITSDGAGVSLARGF